MKLFERGRMIAGIFDKVKTPEVLIGNKCSTCNSNIDLDTCKSKLTCGCEFHSHCINKWFNCYNSCPKCSKEIITNEARWKFTTSTSTSNDFKLSEFFEYILGYNLTYNADVSKMLEESVEKKHSAIYILFSMLLFQQHKLSSIDYERGLIILKNTDKTISVMRIILLFFITSYSLSIVDKFLFIISLIELDLFKFNGRNLLPIFMRNVSSINFPLLYSVLLFSNLIIVTPIYIYNNNYIAKFIITTNIIYTFVAMLFFISTIKLFHEYFLMTFNNAIKIKFLTSSANEFNFTELFKFCCVYNVKTFENIDSTENTQNIDNIDNTENIDNTQNIDNTENTEYTVTPAVVRTKILGIF